MDEIIKSLLPAVDEQLQSPDTQFVKETYQRLLKEPDIDDAEARNMIAFCLADEMERMVLDQSDFDKKRYQTLLDLLPTMPEKG